MPSWRLVHGEAEVAKCEEASAALFSEEIAGLSEDMLLAVTEDAPTTPVPRAELADGGLTLVDALERTGLAKSRADARRTIDGAAPTSTTCARPTPTRALGRDDLLHDRYVVLRKGRRDVHVLRPREPRPATRPNVVAAG